MTQPIVIFDLDGTLVETGPHLVESLNHVLQVEGLATVTVDDLGALIGQGGRAMLAKAFTMSGRPYEEDAAKRIIADFLVQYEKTMPGSSVPFDGVMDLTDNLLASGYKVAICTNKTERLAVKLIELLGISNRFSAICGQDTFAVRKPHPDHLFGTIDKAGGDRMKALMIGDSQTDIDTAKAANIPVVAVDFGYSHEHVSVFAPDLVISHFRDLTVERVDGLIKRTNG